MLSHGNAQINTLRIYSKRPVTQATIRKVSRQIIGSEVESVLMLPSAVLLVKKIRLDSVHNVQRSQQQLERSLHNQLISYYAQAVQAQHGYIPDSAKAVLFQDEAEMLACLARDISLGQHLNHWWWKTVLSNLPGSAGNNLTSLFCYQVRQLPAMLDYLDFWGEATSILNSLDNSAVFCIVQLLAQEYRLNELFSPLRASVLESPNIPRSKGELHTTVGNITDALQPWWSWLAKKRTQDMSAMQSYLFGVGLGLFRDPGKVRSPLFAAELKAWWCTMTTSAQSAESHHRDRAQKGETKDNTDAGGIDNKQERLQQAEIKIAEMNPGQKINDDKAHEQNKHIKSHGSGALIPQKSDENKASLLGYPGILPVNKILKNVQPEQSFSQNDSAASILEPQISTKTEKNRESLISKPGFDSLTDGVYTELGGIFYLINLFHYLELPKCFEEQCKLDEQIGIWGLVELIAKGLLAENLNSYQNDPIWQVLAQLDGREPQETQSENFQFSGEYHIPRLWLDMIHSDDEIYHWAYNGVQLCIWSDAGFVIQQSLCKASSEKQLNDYISLVFQHYFPSHSPVLTPDAIDKVPLVQLAPIFSESISQPLSTWLNLMLPSLQLRLKQALGYKARTDPQADLFADLFFCPATLHVNSTHIDLVSQLKHISLPVRMAGLDRNPGWVPELGRVISFHFN